MKLHTKILAATIVACGLTNAAFAQDADTDSNDSDILNSERAVVTINEAIQMVQSKHSGKVITANLEEKEDSKLVFEIDLVQGSKEMEVWVDAITGEMSELIDD